MIRRCRPSLLRASPFLLACFLPTLTSAGEDICSYVHQALQSVPHTTLERSSEFVSLWDRTKRSGCAVTFETNDVLASEHRPIPMFVADEGTELYARGWRMNIRYQADGPGTSVHGIQHGDTLCLVRYSQPAHLSDSGQIEQSETIRIAVQCSQQPDRTAD